MTLLIVLSLVWAALVVGALVVVLTMTAWRLRQARLHLAGIADDLTEIARQAEPLDARLHSIGTEIEAIAQALERVDGALADIRQVIEGVLTPQEG